MTSSFNQDENHILVGLGGTGGKILRAFKMRMFEEFPTQEERKKIPVSILYVDSTEEMMPKDGKARPDFRVMGQDASFTNNEFFNIKEVDVEYLLGHINHYPSLKGIVDNVSVVKSAIGSLGEAAGQKRRAGRLLFAANAVGFVNSLHNAFARCTDASGKHDKLFIHIFAGLCGGTGSGSIIDAILQSRKAFPEAKISVYAMIPEMTLPNRNIDQGRYYQNGYAALNELNALQSGRWFPQDVTGHGELRLYNDRIKGVADGLTVYSNVNVNGLMVNSFEELPKLVSDYVFARIFLINSEDKINHNIIRAYSYENIEQCALEFDETAQPDRSGQIPAARTKKVNSFGIKRVIYPELRILKHITYTVGESVLYQFKYNNWRENQGFVNEERNKDYRKEYFNKENLSKWMLDYEHLTLEKKILESDTDYPGFNEYWHDKAIGYAEDAKKSDCPLNELDNIMGEFYLQHFREEGVEGFYAGKERAIPEMAREVRSRLENELYDKWKIGDISIVELQKVSKLLLEFMGDLRTDIETKIKEEKNNYEACDQDREATVDEWSHLGILQRMVGKGARLYADHQNILTDYYTSKTELVALDFAKKLAAKLFIEFGKMDVDIMAFGQKINEAIDETERLISAQRKINKGLEDMKGAIIEVCEEESMVDFEVELKVDKVEMPNIARQIREVILPQTDFINFGVLANEISIDDVKDAFDVKLTEIVKARHNEKAESEDKVLGLNILTQLQQKLKTDDDIKSFAYQIVNQSGVYLKLNNDQINLHLRNNEGPLSPSEPASRNKKAILVSIPSPDKNESLKKFADKLEDAFKSSFRQGTTITTIDINRDSPRTNEMSIFTVEYCFPLRAVDWLSTYKQRYENFLNTGNAITDEGNAVLLHSEGNGKQYPSLFAVDDAEEDSVSKNINNEVAESNLSQKNQTTGGIPSIGTGLPPMAPPPFEKKISLFLAINGQQYGPYENDMCKQLVKGGQLTKDTLVWMEGLSTWTTAGQVPEIQFLFVPDTSNSLPPIPPVGGGVPPIM